MIFSWVFNQHGIDAWGIYIYLLYLANLEENNGVVKYKLREMAKKLKINVWVLRKSIEKLEKMGLLSQENKKRESSINMVDYKHDIVVTTLKKLFNTKSNIVKKQTREEKKLPIPILNFIEFWNKHIADEVPKITKITEGRKRHLMKRIEENPDPKFWENVVRKINASDFLRGGGNKGWVVTLDFLIKNPENCIKISEGLYDNREGS